MLDQGLIEADASKLDELRDIMALGAPGKAA